VDVREVGVRKVGVRNTWAKEIYGRGLYLGDVCKNAPGRVRPTLGLRILELFLKIVGRLASLAGTLGRGQARFIRQPFLRSCVEFWNRFVNRFWPNHKTIIKFEFLVFENFQIPILISIQSYFYFWVFLNRFTNRLLRGSKKQFHFELLIFDYI
jgi:hypothetical protein